MLSLLGMRSEGISHSSLISLDKLRKLSKKSLRSATLIVC
jgi:hypothetical protein